MPRPYQLHLDNTVKQNPQRPSIALAACCIVILIGATPNLALADETTFAAARHAVAQQHPRLLGSRARLQTLAAERGDAYARMVAIARGNPDNEHGTLLAMALVSAIEQDPQLGRRAVEQALRLVDGPIRKGHVTFGHDLTRAGMVYDLCHPYWTEPEKTRFHAYLNATYDANIRSETSPLHNAYYGYKWHGIGIAAYASYYDNPRAAELLVALQEDYRTRAAPALALAGAGGGWAEGYYINYWLYEWLLFCEVARHSEGLDYYSLAPDFYRQRAIAGIFETYPGIREYGSRRMQPMGDGGGRIFGGDRDEALSARRILVNHYRDDPAHQVVHAFNEITPKSSVGLYAYKDFLWRDTTVPTGDLDSFKISHYSPGAGFVYARSAWTDDASHLFFKSGDRFTAHQHLDVGHFLIYKRELLAGDGGHYDDFASEHAVNYYLRSIAHNTILVHNPNATWPAIRAGKVTGNDGGQHHNWPHHNGHVEDAAAWQRQQSLYDIADITAYEDRGDYLHIASDGSRAYDPAVVETFTRQIVFIRPGTFVIFDRVRSSNPNFRKTWLLQAMKPPTATAPLLQIDHGQGRLFVQTVLPTNPEIRMAQGDSLYNYDGQHYPPSRDTGPAPECRIEISPPIPAHEDLFLHILTTTETTTDTVPQATAQLNGDHLAVQLNGRKLRFAKNKTTFNMEVATAIIQQQTTALPQALTLQQNQPNPFNSTTIIQFTLPVETTVELTIYNLTGQKIATIVEDIRGPGAYAVRWNGRDNAGNPVASGVYQYQLRAGNKVQTQSAVLLR